MRLLVCALPSLVTSRTDMKICFACKARFDSSGWECPACGANPPRIKGFPALARDSANSYEGFHSEYFEQLAGLEIGNFWFESRNKLILLLLKKYFTALGSLLEIGCGTGFVLSGIASAFPLATLAGAEIYSAGLIHAARRVPRAEFLQVDASESPFELHFDVLCAFDVLEHIQDDAAVFRQIFQTLKPGGILILTVPQHPALWSAQDELACHVRRYTSAELHRKVSEAGFEILDSGSFVTLLLPLMWLSRWLRNINNGASHDPMAELRIGAVANRILNIIMFVEILLIRFGMRFSVGGSRFVVARKQKED